MKVYSAGRIVDRVNIGLYIRRFQHRRQFFAEAVAETVADELGVELLAQVPIDVRLAEAADSGKFEYFNAEYMNWAADFIEEIK